MIRAQYERRGPVPQDVIHAVELETPQPAAGQALLEVIAAPINPSDLLTLTGEYGDLPPLPAIGGREGVGRVAALGPDTPGPEVGRLVLLPRGGGTWSSHVVGEAAHLVELPNEADPQQLAMMTINPPTAALLLSEFVKLNPGEWVIQNAANSAVGPLPCAARPPPRPADGQRRAPRGCRRDRAGNGWGCGRHRRRAPGRAGRRRQRAEPRSVWGSMRSAAPRSGRLADCLCRDAFLVNYGRMSGEPCTVQPDAFVFREPDPPRLLARHLVPQRAR